MYELFLFFSRLKLKKNCIYVSIFTCGQMLRNHKSERDDYGVEAQVAVKKRTIVSNLCTGHKNFYAFCQIVWQNVFYHITLKKTLERRETTIFVICNT